MKQASPLPDTAALRAMYDTTRWWDLPALRPLLGMQDGSVVLAHDFGPNADRPDYAFAAAKSGNRQNSLVILHPYRAAVCFHIVGGDALSPSFLQLPDAPAQSPKDISTVSLAGLLIDEWAVLFHAEPRSATSAVDYWVESKSRVRSLVTGLAPGTWEVWCNGWLEDPPSIVRPRAGALYYEKDAGNYFLRRRE